MVVVLLCAAALRLWALPSLPLGLHYDEAANVILARQIAAGDRLPLFIRAYTGKEVLFFYAAAPWLRMTGGAPWGLRLGAAMLGVLTVAATYAATRALLTGRPAARWIARLAAGWVAVAFPHVLLSRYGFRAIAQPLLQALTVAAIWYGLRRGRRRWLIAGGACLGLTAYTYLAARLFPLPLALAWPVLMVRTPRDLRRRRLGQLALVLAVAALVFAPLGVYFLRHPDAFTTRITQVAAPSGRDALRGLWRCVQALAWPGAGDGYVRFNAPGRPMMGAPVALLAMVGLGVLVTAQRRAPLDTAGRVFVLAAVGTMLLPSALATSEITPSNLRLVGLFPFLGILPAWGAVRVVRWIAHAISAWESGRAQGQGDGRKGRPQAPERRGRGVSRWGPGIATATALGALALGVLRTGRAYGAWAASPALFYAADGEMVLAARALDALDLTEATAYIASEHYRHPTVAALARAYPRAKWLTGGASLVLPPEGAARYLVPRTLAPPAPWPSAVTKAWSTHRLLDPADAPALAVHALDAATIAALRPAAPAADFAHVVWLHDAEPLAPPCRVAAPCPILVTWEARAPYPALEPVVRWLHPRTGEWARALAFHYPPEQWAVGDVVLDQVALTPPVGTPPGDGYQVGVGFFDPERETALPRLVAERFAGLEVRFPPEGGFALAPMAAPPTPDQVAQACPGVPRRGPRDVGPLRLLGWTGVPAEALPGEPLDLRLCWQAEATVAASPPLTGTLVGPEPRPRARPLYVGAPALETWRPHEVLEDRYPLRLPKDLAAGRYELRLDLGMAPSLVLGGFAVQPITRTFAAPSMAHRVDASFGGQVRLLGYDVGDVQPGTPLTLTLYWRASADLQKAYTVFVHLLDADGQPVAQVDETPQHAQRGPYPTSLWMAGEVVADTHTLHPPATMPPGRYGVKVGLYRPLDGDTLTVEGEGGLLLTRLSVDP